MAWYEVHDEAERLEHAVSTAFEKKLIEKLGHKETCPHGNGLALRSVAERRKKGLCLLTEAEAGAKYRIASVYERDRKLLEFFDKEGIRPGRSHWRRRSQLRRHHFHLCRQAPDSPRHVSGRKGLGGQSMIFNVC